ncbi:hypothetical protein QYM36_011681 [Artemia franciscana]|uniref:glutathione peroxidase n=1 Tax=Artemia franciscana TaxID=6661 RepID=A0AA88L9F4_ARTSF|nr:hypothetical protein QYM36_011681 [Artemia franciscana]
MKDTFNGTLEILGFPCNLFGQDSCPPTRDFFMPTERLFYSPLRNNDIHWNFEKFLIDPEGLPLKRYDPGTKVSEIIEDLENILNGE